jgi:dipeptidyl aminopeptidase/acylaminoacyl peptidase
MAQTPILDRNLFFGNPLISGGQLSPDGKTISFLKAYNGIMNVWVKDFNEPFEKARPLTDSKRPLYGYFWTEDGRYVLYVKDKDGDENINVFAVDPLSATPAGQEVPESRNLTPLNEVTAQIYHVSKEQPDLLWVGLNDRDKAWHDLYQVQLSTGERTLLYKNEDRITGYMFDWDDKLRLLSRTDEKGNTTLLRKDGEKLVAIYETSVTEGASVPGWEKGNKRFYLETNKGELNLSTLFLMDPLTKEMTLLESDPENRVDFGSLRLDENTHEVICTSYEDDRVRHYWKNKTWEANYNFLKSKFLGREVSFQSSTRDYSKFLVGITGDRYAAESWFFDAKSRELIHQYTPRPELKEVEAHLAPMEAVRYPSSDGLEIPAYLTIPVGVEAKQLPLVVLVHGGPKGPRDNWGYDPEAQFLANRGYAVLQPNFRASGGYGKAFLNAGDLQWGKLMQDDITWGVKHLVDRGIADKHRVAIMGGSYGGYATLAGLAFTPDLYACGVDIVGPSNILTLLNSIPAYWEAGRAFLYGMVGDPQTDAGRELIHNASPLFRAEQIKKPLLIIQGANDPRVKQAEADQIVIALRDRGHDVSYLLAGDEGHGFAKPINRMAMYAEVERFLASKLGGRYQESMPEEVAKRLAELRVDVTKVTYTKPEALAIAKALPELKVQVDEGTETWQVKLAVQGQQLPMTIERTRLRRDGNWLITDVTSGPLGKMVNSATYSANWQSLSRSIEQGGQTIEGVHQPGKVMVKMGEQVSELTYEGALLCDGPGRDYIVAGMPLEKGFEIGVMMPDFASNKVSSYRLKCEGTASIEGRECLKVVIANVENTAERTVIWFDAKSRSPLQIEQVIPALQNATLTMKRGG